MVLKDCVMSHANERCLCLTCILIYFFFDVIANLWKKYKSGLVCLFLIIGVVLILFIIAQRKYSEVKYFKTSLITLNLRINNKRLYILG
jgi:hypothetical protein